MKPEVNLFVFIDCFVYNEIIVWPILSILSKKLILQLNEKIKISYYLLSTQASL